MKKLPLFAVALLITVSALPLGAQDAKPEAAATGVKAEILRQISDAESKLVALAEEEPNEKYAWRPGEGVRSVGEVYIHVGFANYFLPTVWGAKQPEGMGKPADIEKSHGADKGKALGYMKDSFAHVKKAVEGLSDADLDKAVNLFGRSTTTREALLLVATHAHEHLGQAIAYARMNGITPPWSRRGE